MLPVMAPKLSPLGQLLADIAAASTEWKKDDLDFRRRRRSPGQLTPWFRGVSSEEYECEPTLLREYGRAYGLHRNHSADEWREICDRIRELEKYICNRFQTMAARLVRIPRAERITWRSILQHHGLPSRLLDWSANPLVGIYFAVRKEDDHKAGDAKLWMLNPRVLSARAVEGNDKRHIADPQDPEVIDWFDLTENLKHDALPLPIIPRHVILRHSAQHARFTLHGPQPKWWDRVRKGGKVDPKIRREFLIKKKDRLSIRQELSQYGITPATVFPSLDGIGQELKLRLVDLTRLD